MAFPRIPRTYCFGTFFALFAINACFIVGTLVLEGPKQLHAVYGVKGLADAHLWRIVAAFTAVGAIINMFAALLPNHPIPNRKFTEAYLASTFNWFVVVFYLMEAFVWKAVNYELFVGMLVVLFIFDSPLLF